MSNAERSHIRGSANETEEQTMRTALGFRGLAVLLVALMTSSAWADNYSDTVDIFKNAIPSTFFENSYGYAIFPTIGKGGAGIGGAHGKGRGAELANRSRPSRYPHDLPRSPGR